MRLKSKIILDLCGGTGAWGKPYREAGYDVRLVTLPGQDVRTYEPPENVHGILAAPPCTMFSLARQTAKTPRDFEGAMETIEACLRIVWKCRKSGSLKWWAMENPPGYLRQFIGRPAFTFQHWEFDEKARHCKPTDVWGYFTHPAKRFTVKPFSGNRNLYDGNWQSPAPPKGYEHLAGDRAAIRAITPAGFAQAFFKANK